MKKKAKPSKVIYVVCRPTPGQSKGDWCVRMHGKILSHHKLKSAAVKAARTQARKRNYSVMVQNRNGSFSHGFHPVKRR